MGGLLALAAGAWWLMAPASEPAPAEDAVQTTTVAATSATDANGSVPADFQMPKPVDATDQDEVERLLNAGDALFEYGTKEERGRKLTFPDDDSALGYYRRALALDPDNARARVGIAGIVAFYRSAAYQYCERGQWVSCGVFVRAGLAVDAEDVFLRQLQDAVTAGESGETPVLPPAPPSG
jgi:tetratricopeptide (TPR) repeat protein